MAQLPFKYKNFTGFQYLDIQKNGVDLQRLTTDGLNGLTPMKLQEMIGEKHGAGKCRISGVDAKGLRYSTLFKGINKNQDVKIRIDDDSKINQVLEQFRRLESKLNNASQSGGISFDMLLASTKQGYEAQASFLTEKIRDKEQIISELKKDIDDLENDLNDCEKESAKHSGIGQYLAIGEKIANIYLGGKTKTPISLKESNISDIPEQILLVLGVIDWQKIDAESINRIANSIQQYLSVIPKEFFKGQ